MLKHFKRLKSIANVLGCLWAGGLILSIIHVLLPDRMGGYQLLWSNYMAATSVSLVVAAGAWMLASHCPETEQGMIV